MVRIAVEEPFVSVKEALEKNGYSAEMLKEKTDAMDYDCVVVRDHESLADFHMNVPIVEAHGRTLYEIVEEIEERLVRSGKIEAPEKFEENSGGGGFIKGAITGAIVGAAAGLLLTPKSGKDMQATLKEKTSGTKEKLSGTVEQVKDKTSGVTEKVKGKTSGVTEKVKDKTSGVTDKAKEKVDELKSKREEKKEEKELKKQEKEVVKEAKKEEQAIKEHEKAEKKAEKEIAKAEKEAAKEKGGIEVVEFGASDVTSTDTGSATITPKNSQNK